MPDFNLKNFEGEKRQKLYEIIKAMLLISVLCLVLILLMPIVNSEKFRDFVQSLGPLAPLAIIFYIVASHIFVPLSATPGVLLGIAILGIYQAIFCLYLAGIISSTINFYISRKFGRKWVIKLAGEKIMKEIDDFVAVFGSQALILSRLFGFTFFDIISYAAGLTGMNFKKYFIITLLFSSISNITVIFLFKDVDFSSATGFALWVGFPLMAMAAFSVFIKKYLKTRNN